MTPLTNKKISYNDFLGILPEEDKAVVMGLLYFEEADPDMLHQIIEQLEEKERDKIYDILERNERRLRRENSADISTVIIPILGFFVTIIVLIIILLMKP